MLLSIIGDILGSDGENANTSSGGGDDGIGGELAGSMSEDELLPGSASSSGTNDAGGDGIDGTTEIGGGDGGDDTMDDAMGDVFGDDGGDDFDLEGGDGEMGDEMSIDGMEAGGDESVSSEVEARVEEMENEIGSLSSTVNTVQSENEKINDSLDDIEENIRKLLEVYEMVTQGVNPFVEDDSLNDTFGPGAGGDTAGSGNFGGQSLFDTDDDGENEESMDDNIADADAEEFLDESIIDGDDEEMDDFDADDEDEFALEEDGDGDDDLGLEDDGDDAAGGDDLSFDELKSEYESGDADWGEGADGESDDADGAIDNEFAEDRGETGDDEFESLEDEPAGDEVASDPDGAALEDDAGSLTDDFEAGEETLEDDGTATETPADEPTIPWDDGGRPYLATVPAEYETEFVVMDWLDYLVGEAGLDGAAETIRFYGAIHWIGEPVEQYLQTILNGFHGGPDVEDPEPRSGLGVDHKRSLWRLTQISTPKKNRQSYEAWLEAESTPILETPAAVDRDSGASDLDITATASAPDPSAANDENAQHEQTGAQLTYTEDAVDGVGDDDAIDVDVGDDGTEPDSGATSAGPSDGADEHQLSAGEAHTITIDDSGSGVDDVGDDPEPIERPGADDGLELPEAQVDTDGGQMIWVDSDVVLSDSGVELQRTADRSGQVERVQSMLEPAGEQSDDDGYVKPLVVSEERADLESWQVDLIRSLFAPEEDSAVGKST
ncbi:flagella accessory C family protein [Salinadaptatus halalkaliphilus]|uniref:Flagella accessory C family protein n=1 Tax=Salinadaptatus halalkaliphilus TaxID=2419781 RepID=A0A4V3VKT0_9EURY|nr:flagella accessory protein C [Salinadaptatus halalkaliphilus]THE62937.1 flagella accessory C family protein [Salinadaptatus halalkaliphilus]